MNAASIAMGTSLMSKRPDSVTILAAYLRELARRGLGCTSNTGSIASALRLSVDQVRTARLALVRSKRLIGSWQVWQSIDGMQFGRPVDNEIEAVKTILRRHFSPVYDVRTAAYPAKLPAGQPDELHVGGRVMSWQQAVALAIELSRKTQ